MRTKTRAGQKKFRRVCDAAAFHLRATDNPSVGHGDAHLLHEIATLMQWKHESWRTELRVLNALSKTPGELIPCYVRHHGLVRNFYLPEKCPAHLRPVERDDVESASNQKAQGTPRQLPKSLNQ